MNQFPGVIGRKIGMTQIFTEDGTVVPCTVVESNVSVVGKRTQDKDGYDAIIVGSGERKEKHTNKPLAGAFKKANVTPRRELRELRCSAEFAASVEVGSDLKVDQLFEAGQFVDVQGTSKGNGFSGVMRRHNFKGGTRTHGTHEYRRHGGSIGTNMTPGRTLPGLKMPGHYGAETISTLNLKVAKLIVEDDLVLIEGAVPGPDGGLVTIRGAVKKKNAGKKKA